MSNFQPIGGSRPFAGLELKTTVPGVRPLASGHAIASGPKFARKPAEPQKPYGDPVHSKDRNGVYVRNGDRVKHHGEGGVTFVVVQVYVDFVVGVGDTVRRFGNNVDPLGWLDVFVPIDCCDCEVVGHHDDLPAEQRRIEREAARLGRGGRA